MLPRSKLTMLDEWIPLLSIVGVLAAIDFSFSPPRETVGGTFISGGLLLAEATLLNLMLVFGSGPFWYRLVVAWAAGLCALGCRYFGGMSVLQPWDDANQQRAIFPMFACAAFLSLMGQVPLWLTRFLIGKRFFSDSTQASHGERQYSLADLCVGTIVVCVTLAAVRSADSQDPRRADDYFIDTMFNAAAVVFYSGFYVLPVLNMFFSRMTTLVAWAAVLGFTIGFALFVEIFLYQVVGQSVSSLFGILLISMLGIGAACTLLRVCAVRWDVASSSNRESSNNESFSSEAEI